LTEKSIKRGVEKSVATAGSYSLLNSFHELLLMMIWWNG
jgi:hypothetical protein